MTDEPQTWDITLEGITALDFIHLIAGIDHVHQEAHKAHQLGMVEEEELDSIHDLMEKVDNCPQDLWDAAEAKSQEWQDESAPEVTDLMEAEDPDSIEEALAAAIESDDVSVVRGDVPDELLPGGEDGDDDDGPDRMFQ